MAKENLEVTVPSGYSDIYMLIGGKEINEHIFQNELVDFKLIYRKDEIDMLERLLEEGSFQSSDIPLVKDDLKSLKKLSNDWIYSSFKTNKYISPKRDSKEFEEITKDILSMQKVLDYCETNKTELPTSKEKAYEIENLMYFEEISESLSTPKIKENQEISR